MWSMSPVSKKSQKRNTRKTCRAPLVVNKTSTIVFIDFMMLAIITVRLFTLVGAGISSSPRSATVLPNIERCRNHSHNKTFKYTH